MSETLLCLLWAHRKPKWKVFLDNIIEKRSILHTNAHEGFNNSHTVHKSNITLSTNWAYPWNEMQELKIKKETPEQFIFYLQQPLYAHQMSSSHSITSECLYHIFGLGS